MGIIGYAKKAAKSITGWETSHFGGFRNIIWDYPRIKLHSSVNCLAGNTDSARDLGFYSADKLVQMFVSAALECKALPSLMKDSKKRVTMTVLGPKTEVYAVPESISSVISRISRYEHELAPLFENYAEVLETSDISVDLSGQSEIPESRMSELTEGGDEDGEGDEGENEGGEGDINASEEDVDQQASNSEMRQAVERLETTSKAERYGRTDTLATYSGGDPKFITETNADNTTVYSNEEIKNAEQLLKMLDISWESHVDVLKGLKTGKIDVSKIAEVPAGNTHIYQKIEEDMNTRPFSVCILCDESGSMYDWGSGHHTSSYARKPESSRIGAQYTAVKSLYAALAQILPSDKIFVYGHGGADSPKIYTYHDPLQPGFDDRIENLWEKRELENNYDGPVIEAIHKRVRDYTSDKVIFIHLSDGMPEGRGYGGPRDVQEFKKIVEKCRRDEFVTVGVGIHRKITLDIYNYKTEIIDLQDMAKQLSHTINKVVKTEFQ